MDYYLTPYSYQPSTFPISDDPSVSWLCEPSLDSSLESLYFSQPQPLDPSAQFLFPSPSPPFAGINNVQFHQDVLNHSPVSVTSVITPSSSSNTSSSTPPSQISTPTTGDRPPSKSKGHQTKVTTITKIPTCKRMTGSDRPYKCDECPQSFNRNHDLKRHKRIHLTVKPYPCGYCEKRFARKDAVKRHWVVRSCKEKLKEVKELNRLHQHIEALEADRKKIHRVNDNVVTTSSMQEQQSQGSKNQQPLMSPHFPIPLPPTSTSNIINSPAYLPFKTSNCHFSFDDLHHQHSVFIDTPWYDHRQSIF